VKAAAALITSEGNEKNESYADTPSMIGEVKMHVKPLTGVLLMKKWKKGGSSGRDGLFRHHNK
jgi:hypothetical protein